MNKDTKEKRGQTPNLLAFTHPGGSGCYHYDFNGNILTVSRNTQTQPAKYAYSAFGEILLREGSFDSRFQFSTKEFDASTGLNYYGFRHYIPMLGKWLSRDPIQSPESAGFKRDDGELRKQVSSAMQSLDELAHLEGISIPGQSRLVIEEVVRVKISSILQRRNPDIKLADDLYGFCNNSPVNRIDSYGLMATCTAFSAPCWGRCPRCCLGYLGGSLEDHENSPSVRGLCVACTY